MNTEFINLSPENLADEHLCCIIRSKVKHQGIEAKRQWLAYPANHPPGQKESGQMVWNVWHRFP